MQSAVSDAEAKAAADATVRSFVGFMEPRGWRCLRRELLGRTLNSSAPLARFWRDAQRFAQLHVDLWAGIYKGSHMIAKVRRVRRLDPNHIIIDLNTELSGARELPPGIQNQSNKLIRAHLKHILEKRNGEWKVSSAQNTYIAGK